MSGGSHRTERTGQTLISNLPIDQFGPYGLTIIFATIACVLSTLMSNTASAALMMPLAISLPADAVVPVALGIAYGSSVANALPISTPPNTLAFSMGGLTAQEMAIPGTLSTIAGLVFVGTIGWWLWGVLGLT